ncbi:pescadillo homolog [Paramacrobiotus metropolitanus]|uniref:pescadillo homolog n=1 Tax=Paramacrobiotus metropolitanus TaxID=2943436 RepID=UPI00244646F4|nr:pescadillo homolog [Paramacrobiotus metropolitanus]
MGKMKKKFAAGTATQYISRSQAVKRLQISLKDFRRLCILKGVYPNEPRNKKKANKGSTGVKTFYFLKDIQYLAHDPIIQKFRDFKVFIKKLKKAEVYKDGESAARLKRNKPVYKLDHIVKERYPSFVDAVRDLDDCLSMCFLFATFPKSRSTPERIVRLCRRLTVEFMHYVMAAKALRKVFVSIKGVYYQADIQGQTVTWITPHALPSHQPADVDFKIMLTFTEFYVTMLGFVNFHLFTQLNLNYPPKIAGEDDVNRADDRDLVNVEENFRERIFALNQTLLSSASGIEDDAALDEFPATTETDMAAAEATRKEFEKTRRLQKLFAGMKFFLNREVPRETLVFAIRSCGGECSWDRTTAFGATFAEDDQTINYQIVDRPVERRQQVLNGHYVQPQWVFDSINARELLPVEPYFVGQKLPPHLSPFADNSRYQPIKEPIILPAATQRLPDIGLDAGEEKPSDSEDEDADDETSPKKSKGKKKPPTNQEKPEMAVKRGIAKREEAERTAQLEAAEEKKLSVMMMGKKQRHLYEKIMHSKKQQNKEVRRLQEKRKAIEQKTGKK